MIDSGSWGSLTREQLFQLEAICDQFEADLAEGAVEPLESYVEQAPPPLRFWLESELEAIAQAYLEAGEKRPDQQTTRNFSKTNARSGESRPIEGDRMGRFVLTERLGAGGAGIVWKARDERLDRWVALKIPYASFAEDPKRFAREVQLAAQLRHPHIVRVYEAGQHLDLHFLVCEWIQGESLAETLRRRRFDEKETVELLVKVADALAYSHQQGVIHRDIKPHNILLGPDGQPHLADFGLAKLGDSGSTLTVSGELLGTPSYMAPEQARGESSDADERTDVYSLGVVLFKMLTGETPFRGTIESVLYQVIHDDPPSPRTWNRQVSRELEIICLKCLSKEPRRRFVDAAELRDELRRVASGRPIQSRPIGLWGRLSSWAWRNKKVAALSSCLLAALLFVSVASTIAAVVLRNAVQSERFHHQQSMQAGIASQKAAVAAERSRIAALKSASRMRRAMIRADEAAAVRERSIAFLQNAFESSDPSLWAINGGAGPVAGAPKNLLAASAKSIQNEFKNYPLVQCRLMDIVGNSCRSVGLYSQADQLLSQSTLILRAELDRLPSQARAHALARNRLYRGWLEHDLGNMQAAEIHYQAALQQQTRLHGREKLLTAQCEFQFARLLLAVGQNERARRLFENSLSTRSQFFPADSQLVIASKIGIEMSAPEGPSPVRIASLLQGADWGQRLARSFTKVLQQRASGQLDAACESYAQVLEQLRQRIGVDHPLAVLAVGDLAGLNWEAGNYEQAYHFGRQAVQYGRKLAPNHRHLRHALERLAFETRRAGMNEEAEEYYREIQKIRNGKFDFEVHHGLLWTNYAEKRYEEAAKHAEILWQRRQQYMVEQTAWVSYARARVFAAQGFPEKSNKADRFALQEISRLPVERLKHPIWLQRMSLINAHNGQLDRALLFCRQALKQEQLLRPADHPRIADRLMGLGALLEKQGKHKEASQLFERALQIRLRRLPAGDRRIAESQRRSGQL